MKKKTYEMNMCEGPLFRQILSFALPLMLSSMLQLLFNAADMIVAGRFVGSSALAAIGSTSALINLIINVFVGLSVGSNVLIANLYGASRYKDVREAVHTSIALGFVGGVFLSIVGILLARPLLLLMGTPENVINEASLYMKIYFLGMPVIMLYNFGGAVLRAVGDTKRPMLFLTIAGVINVVLNVVFVVSLKLGVAGVALATILSQCISTSLVLICLKNSDGCFRLRFKRLKITGDKFVEIMKVGLPAGLQGIIFSLSNVLIQSSVNTFGAAAMAGNTADSNIENFVYAMMNAFHHTVISFTAQNYGAGKKGRLRRAQRYCLVLAIGFGLVSGWGLYALGEKVVRIYSTQPSVIAFALKRMSIMATTYFLCGMQEVKVGYMRGLGHSFQPMIISLITICGIRVLWIYSVFSRFHYLEVLYLSYPVSWIIAFTALSISAMLLNKKLGINKGSLSLGASSELSTEREQG